MTDKKKTRLANIAFMLNGLMLILDSTSLISVGNIVFAALLILAAGINLSMLIKFKNQKAKSLFNYLTFVMNIIVSSWIAVDFFLAGKKFIQYAWVLAAVMSLVALIIQVKKGKEQNNIVEKENPNEAP